MSIRNLIFDFDGTLADSRGLALQLYHDFRRNHEGYPMVTEAQIESLSRLSIPERLKAVNLSAHKLPLLMMHMTKAMSSAANRLHPFAGIPSLLQSLHKEGYGLGIISSNRSTTIDQFLLQHHIRVFDTVMTSRHLFGKSQKIAAFCKKKRLRLEETVYIGDELRDIEACRQAGIKIVCVSWGYDARDLLASADPDGLIDTPEQLFQWLADFKQ